MEEHGAKAYLVNTGWVGGKYGVGERMSLKATRKIIDSILDGSIENAELEQMPIFDIQMPKSIEGVDPRLLNPRNAWSNKEEYDGTAKKLGEMFIANFKKFTDTEAGKALIDAGPQV
jgi:phosphoenolpyruvate carboxykinase (ATP)